MSIHDLLLKEKHRITVQPSGYYLRWHLKDLNLWLTDVKKVNPKKLFDLHRQTSEYYFEFENQNDYDYFTIWNIATYFYELFDAFPYNDYTGTKRAGKTKALTFQDLVCYNAVMTADITGASFFRVIEGLGATFFF